jgi:hypothetical protein
MSLVFGFAKMADFLFEFVSVFINRAVVVQSPLFKI